LIKQFIVEALVMSFIAVLLAILLIYLLLPGFNILVFKQLPFDLFTPGIFKPGCNSRFLRTGSRQLSCFLPVFISSGSCAERTKPQHEYGAGFIRKGLVVLQFSISIILIVCTVIIYQQVQHIKDRDLGYNKEHLLSTEVRGDMAIHFNIIKDELISTGAVENAALSGSPALSMWSTVTSINSPGRAKTLIIK